MDRFLSTESRRDLRNVYSRAVFDSEIFVWGGFLSGYSILYDQKWSDQVSETQIKPSCDRNVPKMRSVDQKVIGTVIWSFVGQECLAKLNRFMGIVSPECRFSTKCSVFIWEHSWRGQKHSWRGQKSHSGWIWSKFQKFSESTHKNQQP